MKNRTDLAGIRCDGDRGEMPLTSYSAADVPEKFPDAVMPDRNIAAVRRARLLELTWVTVVGILARTLIILAELGGVWLSGSASLFVDAIASLFDMLSSLILLAAIRFAARPPDAEHPFGHGRAEPLAGFQLGIFLVVAGCWMAVQNLLIIFQNEDRPQLSHSWIWIIPACGSLLLWLVTLRIHRASREARSTALRAEAIHFQVDMLTSLITTLTLLFAWFWSMQSWLVDHIGAGILAVLMVILGMQAAWENLHQLLDRAPQDEDFDLVRSSALKVPGVLDVEKLRIQHAGPDAHVNIDIEVQPEISVLESHRIAQHVRARIQTDWPFVRDVTVHVEPHYQGTD